MAKPAMCAANPMRLIACDPKWLDVPTEQWWAAFSKPSKGIIDAELAKIVDELQRVFPQPGDQSHRPMPVILRSGRHIAPHRHPQHLIVYYPLGHPARMIVQSIDQPNVKVTPVANTAIYLPPNTLHSVERVTTKTPRLSLALRWQTKAS